jgi:archaellum component FlaC
MNKKNGNEIHDCISFQEKMLYELNAEIDDICRVIEHLKMHSSMVNTQLEQIAKTSLGPYF